MAWVAWRHGALIGREDSLGRVVVPIAAKPFDQAAGLEMAGVASDVGN
jgi:hypothetical protein